MSRFGGGMDAVAQVLWFAVVGVVAAIVTCAAVFVGSFWILRAVSWGTGDDGWMTLMWLMIPGGLIVGFSSFVAGGSAGVLFLHRITHGPQSRGFEVVEPSDRVRDE